MGPYCDFCNNRCFVPFPEGTPKEAISSYRSTVTIIATCQEGQQFEMERTGWCYNKIMEAITMKQKTLEQRFAGVSTQSLKHLLRSNKDNGPYDEYLQAVHDEVERRESLDEEGDYLLNHPA